MQAFGTKHGNLVFVSHLECHDNSCVSVAHLCSRLDEGFKKACTGTERAKREDRPSALIFMTPTKRQLPRLMFIHEALDIHEGVLNIIHEQK